MITLSRRVFFDRAMDYIPVLSAINNAIVLIQKRVFSHIPIERASPYQIYVKDKRIESCLIYSIPFGKLIFRLLSKNKHPGKQQSTDPFANTVFKVYHAYQLRNQGRISQKQYDRHMEVYFSKILRLKLDKETYLNEAFEICLTFMGSSTKLYAQIAHAKFFGWYKSKTFVRMASQQFAKCHCKYRLKAFENKVRDFNEFYNALTPKMQVIALKQFNEYQREHLEPLLSE